MKAPSPEQILKALEKHTNVLLYGPPGTGKTYLMQEVARLFSQKYGGVVPGDPIAVDTEQEEDPLTTLADSTAKVGWVTFHQSYSYEDFVIGLRPDTRTEKLISLVPVPGLLLQLSAFARQPGCAALLAIDEINRGNVSRIFGEFITLLEPDKRLLDSGDVGATTVQVTLPYLRPGETLMLDLEGTEVPIVREFTLPRSLYTLASMNSVDKSVVPLDTALRRRFHVVGLPADEDSLAELWGVPSPRDGLVLRDPLTDCREVRQLALQVLYKLNEGIRAFLGSEYCLGQWYLTPLTDNGLSVEQALAVVADLWESSFYPQLQELFQGRVDQLVAVLDLEAERPGAPVRRVAVDDSFVEAGGLPYVERQPTTAESLIAFLRHVGGVTTPQRGSGG
ncbi:MAG: McrB family protein [Candidatus Dormibacteria bacterium]